MGANGGGFSFKLMNAMADKLAGGSGPSPDAQAHQAAFPFARIVSVSHQAVVFPKTFAIRCALQQSRDAPCSAWETCLLNLCDQLMVLFGVMWLISGKTQVCRARTALYNVC